MRNQFGTEQWDREYTPYGAKFEGASGDERFMFTGHQWDGESGLYYAPFRYYSPFQARWTTRDPLGMVDGPNVYAYVMGNPVRLIDPLGLSYMCFDRGSEFYWWCRRRPWRNYRETSVCGKEIQRCCVRMGDPSQCQKCFDEHRKAIYECQKKPPEAREVCRRDAEADLTACVHGNC